MIRLMKITHSEQEEIYRKHNIRMLDDLREGDLLLRHSGGRGKQLIKVFDITIHNQEAGDFLVFYQCMSDDYDPDTPAQMMRNMKYIVSNISKQVRDLSTI